ncbi:Uncharacterized protein FWK35_00002772 [Aphis craccivora]|uniref:Secreted protein n=1 Tax=Aphis craccivora TaxID=307492 RepID=A0A6G0ZAE8_APHCR|nr:Uncharacterized protein FWK35_00002772 [Aphis craccivora]
MRFSYFAFTLTLFSFSASLTLIRARHEVIKIGCGFRRGLHTVVHSPTSRLFRRAGDVSPPLHRTHTEKFTDWPATGS